MLKEFNASIILVDDDVLCLNLYQQFLKQLGYHQVHLFDNGNDCLDNIVELRPQIVFLDYNMDGLNGVEVFKQIKQIDSSIIVFFISGQEDISIAVSTIQLGAMDYIVKSSINSDKMRAIMERAEAALPETPMVAKTQSSFLKRLFS